MIMMMMMMMMMDTISYNSLARMAPNLHFRCS